MMLSKTMIISSKTIMLSRHLCMSMKKANKHKTTCYSIRNFSSSDDSRKNDKGLFTKFNEFTDYLSSKRSQVIYVAGGVSVFYLFTKGFYNITYDLLASSPASMLKYGFFGGVASSSLFHMCTSYFTRFIYMSPERVYNNALIKIKKNDTIDSILGHLETGESFKSYSLEPGGLSIAQGIYVRPKMKMIFNISSNRGNGLVKVSAVSQNGITIVYDHISILLDDGSVVVVEGNKNTDVFNNIKLPQV